MKRRVTGRVNPIELIEKRINAKKGITPSKNDIEIFKAAQRAKLTRIYGKVNKGLDRNARNKPGDETISFSSYFYGLKHPSKRISIELCEKLTSALCEEIFSDYGIQYSYSLFINEVSAEITISATVDKELEKVFSGVAKEGKSH